MATLERANRTGQPASEPVEADLRDAFEAGPSLIDLWDEQLLCDVLLRPRDGPDIHAHKVCARPGPRGRIQGR
jgi:hypothetical protein